MENTPTPMVLDRVTEIFDAENLQYLVEDFPFKDGDRPIVRTGFDNCSFAISLADNFLLVEAQWRGEPTSADAPRVLAAVNEWNLTQVMPTACFIETQSGVLTLKAQRSTLTTHGMSRNQIGAFVMSTIEGSLNMCSWFDREFPQLVTWEANHND